MRKSVIILFLLLGIKSAFSECSMSGMQFFPKEKNISLNSMFIIQGYAMSQKTITSFYNRKIYLENKNGELIELKLKEMLKGQMGLMQAIFKPSKELKPNTFYFLKYTDQTESEIMQMKKWNSAKKENEYVYWKTSDKRFLPTLNKKLTLEFKKNKVIYYGCGPSANAIFSIKNKNQIEVWFKTEVIDLKTNKKAVFYIKGAKGELNVGHGMCSGAFKYAQKGLYKVRFLPMNTDGKSLKKTNWITFESPFMTNKDLFGN